MFKGEHEVLDAMRGEMYESITQRIRDAVAQLGEVNLTGANDTLRRRALVQATIIELAHAMQTEEVGAGVFSKEVGKEVLKRGKAELLNILLRVEKALAGLDLPPDECPPPERSYRFGDSGCSSFSS